MPSRDPRVDAYIARAPEFARPILEHLRALVHEACPEVRETIKWGMPGFEHHGNMAGMAAFKAHATFGLWRAALILGDAARPAEPAMGQFGRITKLADLPPRRVLVGYLKQAAKLNELGVKPPARRARKAQPEAVPSAEFAAALARNRKARAGFEAASPSCRREYVEWIDDAKRDETRARRIATAVAQLAEGKSLNWKYERPKVATPRSATRASANRPGAAKSPAAKAPIAKRAARQAAGTRTRSARGRTR